jgi:uncharacterized iron-regulated membrane protein
VTRQFDRGKLVLNLHTGKIGGETGKVIMSLAALMMVFLTASGVYMWIKPVSIRRQNAKARAASTPTPARPATSVLPQAESAA